jgi:DNA-binding GntR family transcriptional regulator
MRYRKLDNTDSSNNVDLLFIHHKNIIKALEEQNYDSFESLVSSHAHLCLTRMPILLEKYPDFFIIDK